MSIMKSQYININDPDFNRKVLEIVSRNEGGTYSLHIFQNGKPKSLSRAFGVDEKGILYIGENEKDLLSRVNSLRKSIMLNCNPNQKKPQLGGHQTLSKKYYRIRKHIDENQLHIIVNPIKVSNKEDESALIEAYVRDHGEIPPLNGTYGNGTKEYWHYYH